MPKLQALMRSLSPRLAMVPYGACGMVGALSERLLMDGTRLLVMDDDPVVARVIVAMTETLGGLARVATRVDDLLNAIDEWAPTHITVDLRMPGADGVQVMNLLAQRGCTARIIVCSGMGDLVLDAAMRTAASNGLDVVGVLRKPFTLAQLKTLLRGPTAPTTAGSGPA